MLSRIRRAMFETCLALACFMVLIATAPERDDATTPGDAQRVEEIRAHLTESVQS